MVSVGRTQVSIYDIVHLYINTVRHVGLHPTEKVPQIVTSMLSIKGKAFLKLNQNTVWTPECWIQVHKWHSTQSLIIV